MILLLLVMAVLVRQLMVGLTRSCQVANVIAAVWFVANLIVYSR